MYTKIKLPAPMVVYAYNCLPNSDAYNFHYNGINRRSHLLATCICGIARKNMQNLFPKLFML